MNINDEEKRQIMEELARGNPEGLTQEPSSYPAPSDVKLEAKDYQNFDDFAQRSLRDQSQIVNQSTELLPATQPDQQWQRIGTQVSSFLAQLPEYLSRLFNQYKQPIISVALILAAIVTLRVVLAVVDALDDIPLLAPAFELIGIGYCVWFVYRYLLKEPNRQELSQEIQAIKQQLIGS